jgi:predicted nucleic acid-binding protein
LSRIYWDAMLFIYWLEDRPHLAERVDRIRSRMQQRRDELITSALTFGEVLAGPYRRGLPQLAEKTRGQLRSMVSEVVPFTLETTDHYARIRGSFGIKPANAVHLACAAQARTDLFLTNDTALLGKVIPGIQFIAGLDSNIL